MKKIILISVLLLTFTYKHAFAGWPVGKHHYILSSSIARYAAINRWDAQGKYITNEMQKFSATTIGLSCVYGIQRNIDLSVSLPIVYQRSIYSGSAMTNSSLGDLQMGLSFVLASFKYSNYITLYTGIKAPLYNNTVNKYIGLGNAGVDLRLSNSGSLSEFVSYNIDLGFAQYVGNGAPRQYLTDVSLSYSLDRWNQVGINAGAGRSVSTDKRSLQNTLANRDFEFVRMSANYGHSFSKRISLSCSLFYTVAGRNTGEGYGGIITAQYRLPFR